MARDKIRENQPMKRSVIQSPVCIFCLLLIPLGTFVAHVPSVRKVLFSLFGRRLILANLWSSEMVILYYLNIIFFQEQNDPDIVLECYDVRLGK